MTQAEFDALLRAIHEKYKAALVSLESIRWLINDAPADAAPHSRSGTNPPKPDKTAPAIPDREDDKPGKLCENACGRKLRSDSKSCETCGKKLCSHCRPTCAECKQTA